MIALINKLLDWFKALFWKEEMELTLVGLQYSGKTTFVNVIAVREAEPLQLLSDRSANRTAALISMRANGHCYPAVTKVRMRSGSCHCRGTYCSNIFIFRLYLCCRHSWNCSHI